MRVVPRCQRTYLNTVAVYHVQLELCVCVCVCVCVFYHICGEIKLYVCVVINVQTTAL